jgi:hypothetical protein
MKAAHWLGVIASLVSWWAVGCEVKSATTTAGVPFENRCESNADCIPQGGLCQDSLCTATTWELGDVIVEVTPSQLSAGGGKPRFIQNLPQPSWEDPSFPLLVPNLATVNIRVTPAAATSTTAAASSAKAPFCNWIPAQNGSLGMHATLIPRLQRLGLPSPSYARRATPLTDGFSSQIPLAWLLQLTVPPETYDVYLDSIDNPDCPVPPMLFRSEIVPEKGLSINRVFPTPNTIAGKVKTSSNYRMAGWRVELVDPTTGLTISTIGQLVPDPTTEDISKIGVPLGGEVFPIEYFAFSLPEKVTGYLKFSPPANQPAAPTFLFDTAALDPFGSSSSAINVDLDLSAMTVSNIDFSARVELENQGIGVQGALWLRNRSIRGVPEVHRPEASYSVLIPATINGLFQTRLLPGLYDGLVVPDASSGLSTTKFQWEIAEFPLKQGGRIVAVPQQTAVQFQLRVEGKPLKASPFDLVPAESHARQADITDAVLGTPALAPSAIHTITPSSGDVVVLADRKEYDLTIRNNPATGFPWLVKPGIFVETNSSFALDNSLPVRLEGLLVSSDQTPVTSAVLRFYAKFDSPTGQTRYLRIAETRPNSFGFYSVLLPAKW